MEVGKMNPSTTLRARRLTNSNIEVTFVFNPVLTNFIRPALESLYKYTPVNFRVIVVDQTKDGVYGLVHDYADLIIRNPKRKNMGFAKSMNEGIIHGLYWGSKYVAACNDDILMISDRWWQGILDQFDAFPEMKAVNPASPIEPGFGYGLADDGHWIPGNSCPPWGIQIGNNIYPKAPDGSPITLEIAQTKKGYDMLLAHRQGHIEGFAGWFVVGKRDFWENVGLYDERFGPAGAEDYQLCHRIYLAGGRASATMRSFVWHEWMASKKRSNTTAEIVPYTKPSFQNCGALFEFSPDGANSPIFPPRDEPDKPFGNKRKLKQEGFFVEDPR